MTIEGGYILQPRTWDSSPAAHYPPVVRELWFYLLRNVSHKEDEICKRGEGYFTLEKIQQELSWKVGYRPMKYSKPQLTKSLRRLRESNMIATPKATHGVFVRIMNYDFYQTPANYESNDEEITKGLRRKREGNALKNGKEDKKEERESEERENINHTPADDHENVPGKTEKPKRTKSRKSQPKPDFSEGEAFKNPGFSPAFCAGHWQDWCIKKNAPYRTQEVAEEALSLLYELSRGDEKLAADALREAWISNWQSFKWHFKHLEEQKQLHDHATTQTNHGNSHHGADNLRWLESHT